MSVFDVLCNPKVAGLVGETVSVSFRMATPDGQVLYLGLTGRILLVGIEGLIVKPINWDKEVNYFEDESLTLSWGDIYKINTGQAYNGSIIVNKFSDSDRT